LGEKTVRLEEIQAFALQSAPSHVLLADLVDAAVENDRLRQALKAAILSTRRTVSRCVDYDPAGSTYEVDWLPMVREWAGLCGLDLTKHDPEHYSER
jgi:hypothetical protein